MPIATKSGERLLYEDVTFKIRGACFDVYNNLGGDFNEKQFWRYLKATDYKLGFLVNFGSHKLEIRRRVFDKARTVEADNADNNRSGLTRIME